MSRPLRIEFPGAVYHVTSRGDRREAIFLTDADRAGLLDIVGCPSPSLIKSGAWDISIRARARAQLAGKWDEVKRVIPEDVLRVFAQSSTYDKLPEFLREKREYASRMTLAMPNRTPEERERASQVMKAVQAVDVPREPLGLAVPATSV